MHTIKTVTATAFCALALSMPMRALAWGEPGHQLIGSIAEQILAKDHPGTEAQVKQLLGHYSLGLAATWADCVRDVKKKGKGFQYLPGEGTPKVCKQFPKSEQARMKDYVTNNWTQCVYSKEEGCHAAYHFSDIAIQRSAYDSNAVGAHPWDIEHAIAAAVAVLEGKPCPAPFVIKDKTVALFLLAHFVGDLHQPLHVGAIYLSADGKKVDPDQAPNNTPAQIDATSTEGGNLIKSGSENLHHDWDTLNETLGKPDKKGVVTAGSTLVSAAGSIPAGTGADSWDTTTGWANDSLVLAQQAYAGMSFEAHVEHDKDHDYKWAATLPANYTSLREDKQKQQIEAAGAHLAAALPSGN